MNKLKFAAPNSRSLACLSRYGAQIMHVSTLDCEIPVDKRRVVHISDPVLASARRLADEYRRDARCIGDIVRYIGIATGRRTAHRSAYRLEKRRCALYLQLGH